MRPSFLQLLTAALLLWLLVLLTSRSEAALDSVNQLWPNGGATVGYSRDLDIWVTVTKAGVTDAPGRGEGITGVLRYWVDGAPFPTGKVELHYVQDQGDGDEYTALIPKGDLDGGSSVRVDATFTDETDQTTLATQLDQAHEGPPFIYKIDGISRDVIVCFQACLENVPNSGTVCISGWPHELTCWVSGIEMVLVGPSLWQACVVFPRGTPAVVEYQYRKDDWTTWETIPTRVFTINDSIDEMTITDAWDDGPSSCETVASEADSWGSVKARFGD